MNSVSGNLVEINGLSFAYGSRPILRDINMSIPRGKLVAVMGGSGCGKSTLLSLIGGRIRPQTGAVSFDGENVHTLDRVGLYKMRRRLGVLFQYGGLFSDMTVFDNVAFPLREHTNLPASMIRDLVLMKLNAVGLRGAANLKTTEISGGMGRRVALARTIALDPNLIMYDEPFAGLDPVSLAIIARLIRDLNDALGASSILVTHDIAASLPLVDYVYFLANGGIVAHGTPEEIQASTDPLVKQFVNGEPDGPLPFHYPAGDYREALLPVPGTSHG